MFHNRTLNVLSTLLLLVVLCTGQVAAAPNNNADEVPGPGDLIPVHEFTQQALPGTNSFTGSATVPDQIIFTNTGSMNAGRSFHTATLLNNGKVLVAGGFSNAIYLTSVELYDPITGTWSNTDSMSVGRWHHTATLLNNGKVLVAGGYSNGLSFLSSAELYDPITGTWSNTSNMSFSRGQHTTTLLNNGKVLVVGGYSGGTSYLTSAELYNPDTGTWSATGSMTVSRTAHTATLLNNGNVLVAGGGNGVSSITSAELYDPIAGTWSATGNMNVARSEHAATLLNNGNVLVVQGYSGPWQGSAELYNPAAGIWSNTGNLNNKRFGSTITLLNNGKVLVARGSNSSSELYDPPTGMWSNTGSVNVVRWNHTATLLNNNQVLLAGGEDSASPPSLASAELVTLIPSHTFNGTLTLPSGWTNGIISAEFVGSTSAAAINAGALSNDNNTWGSWITATSDLPVTTTWNVSEEGANRPVYLRLRDINDQVATVVTGTVNVDLTAPISSMTPLPSFVGSTMVLLSWSGSDALSGIATYDLQARAESDVQWIDILTNTTETSYTFNGIEGTTYYFRVRAIDAAGNVEAWREPYDTSTVGTDYGLTINNGALFTNKTDVVLTIAGRQGTSQMQVANDGGFAGVLWETYTSHKTWQIIQYGSYVLPRVVYVRYKDINGNVSATYQDDIILDVTPPIGTISVSEASSFQAMASTVTLKLSATDDVSGVSQMLISNQGNFAGATWENYATSRVWTLGSNTAIYVKFRDNAGNVSAINSTFTSATFTDVSLTYWASSYIERLYNAGITGGCSVTPLNYCPDSTVTRAQMAVFLLKGIHGSSYTPPAVGLSTGFTDVATDYWAASWIKQLAAEGITGGCGTGIYCPDATVTRAQMAIFLLKAKYGSSYSPSPATGVFTDVPVGYWADKWIEQLAVEGITGGCGAGIYCPDSSVTRAQMAVFLVKAFSLP